MGRLRAPSETAPGVAGEGRATDNGHLPADGTLTPISTAHLADPSLGEPPWYATRSCPPQLDETFTHYKTEVTRTRSGTSQAFLADT